MAAKKYDVIVIGSGVGGMGSAALLAKDFNQKVLVVEKSPFIGGRTLSFVGKGNKMTVDSQEVDVNAFRQFWEMNSTWAFTAPETPTLEEIFEKGLFDGYTMDSGHGLFWGNKSRARCLLDYLGVPVDIPVNTGFAIVDYFKNKAYQVGKGEPYPWMSEEGFTATMNQLRDMATTDLAALPKLMNVSLQDWLEERDMHPEAYDYIKNLAGSQTANNVPAITPAGDFLGYQAIARYIKMNLVTGSVGTISQPGITAIPLAMEECLNAKGGEVRRNCPVEQTIIERERAKGVIVRTKRGFETIFADMIVCNVPPKMIHSVIHPRHFDQEWIGTIQRFWNPGLLSAMIGLKKNVWEEKGIEERSFIYMPGCIRKEEGFEGGAMDVVMWNMVSSAGGSIARPSLCDKPGRAPEGKRDFCFSMPLLGYEMRNPDKVKRLTAFCESWFKRFFPSWKEDVEFWIWTPCDRAYGDWRPVGTERPDVVSPWVENLYFVGDQYGKRLWGGGVDGASLCAALTVDAMMGTNLEEEIFPPYHRGTPRMRSW